MALISSSLLLTFILRLPFLRPTPRQTDTRAWLSEGELAKALARQDRLVFAVILQPECRRRDAEARAMANQSRVNSGTR